MRANCGTGLINISYNRFGASLALLGLSTYVLLSVFWFTRAHGNVIITAPESIHLFADARRTAPKTVFNLGEAVWAAGTGMPISAGQQRRRFQWISPDGTVERQSEVVTDNQLDTYRIPSSAQVGTWMVKTVDQTNSGFAIARFTVRDPKPDKAAVNLSVGAFGPPQVTAGQRFNYEFNVVNNGPNDAQHVQFVIEIEGGATFQSLTEAKGWTCKKLNEGDTGTITCTIPTLVSSSIAAFKINCQVSESTASDSHISHSARVTSQTTELQEIDNIATMNAIVETPTCALRCAEDITQARDPGKSGATVNYSDPTASSDSCNTVECNPPSGSFFPAGITTVVCSSLAGRECSFNVRITGALAITLNGAEKMMVEHQSTFTDPGATAQNDAGKILPITVSGNVDLGRVGTYTIIYAAADGTYKATATRTVQVVDTTPPHINCPANLVTRLAPGTPEQTSAVNFTLIATDNGAALPVTTVPASGSNFSVGVTTVEASTTDASGNKHACTFNLSMLYRFTGLAPLFSNARQPNAMQAGSEIPVKFSLSGNKGFNIFAPGYPASEAITCNTPQQATEAQTLEATHQKIFSYDTINDQYTYLWKTEAAWAGTCRQLIIKLTDGTEHRANFKFR